MFYTFWTIFDNSGHSVKGCFLLASKADLHSRKPLATKNQADKIAHALCLHNGVKKIYGEFLFLCTKNLNPTTYES